MKKRKFNLFINSLLFVCLIVPSYGYTAGSVRDTSIVKKFNLNANQQVSIKSSSKNLEIKTWNKDEVLVKISYKIEMDDDAEFAEFWAALQKNINMSSPENINLSLGMSKMINMAGNIKIQFNGSTKTYELDEFEQKVSIYTSQKHKLSVNQSFGSLTIGQMNADVDVKANSTKLMIGDCKNLTLNAGFCNDMVIGQTQNAYLDLNSSSGKMGLVNGDLSLKAGFSKLMVENIIQNATISLNSSSFKTKSAQKLTLSGSFIRDFEISEVQEGIFNTNSSEIKIQKIGKAEIGNTSFSNFKIGEAQSVNVIRSSSADFSLGKCGSFELLNGSFTDVKIAHLESGFKAMAKSGNITIEQINKNFKAIDINGEFSDIVLTTEAEASFQFEADFNFTKHELNGVKMNYTDKDMSKEILKGSKGSTGATSEININCKSCTVKVN